MYAVKLDFKYDCSYNLLENVDCGRTGSHTGYRVLENGRFSTVRRVIVSYKRKYVHEVLVNCLFKLAQEKVWLARHDLSC